MSIVTVHHERAVMSANFVLQVKYMQRSYFYKIEIFADSKCLYLLLNTHIVSISKNEHKYEKKKKSIFPSPVR